MASPRSIPSIDTLLQDSAVDALVQAHGRAAVVSALRHSAERWRAAPVGDAAQWIASRTREHLAAATAPSLVPVLNATGVLIHTNLGRAPLARAAAERAAVVAEGYSNLEYDLPAGARGHRHVHAESLLRALTGAQAAVVTNNNAAATMLVLGALAAGREVIVSRGELVEIGGGFRVPDIMAQSGAVLREVGTTNRTRVSDYAAAVNDRTALILRVHPSNFRIEGFTERPALASLTEVAHRLGVKVFEDLGSGWLGVPHATPWPDALRDEPSVRDSLAAGADLVAFSGDKLLGGPQCGLIVGRSDIVDTVRRHPLMRAVRAGKQTYAALEATLGLWLREPSRGEIPLVRMLLTPFADLDRRAHALAAKIKISSEAISPEIASELITEVIDGHSTIGGGSAPQSVIPTRIVALRDRSRSAAQIEAALRAGTPPVIARIADDAVLLDLRTVDPGDDDTLAGAVRRAAL